MFLSSVMRPGFYPGVWGSHLSAQLDFWPMFWGSHFGIKQYHWLMDNGRRRWMSFQIRGVLDVEWEYELDFALGHPPEVERALRG